MNRFVLSLDRGIEGAVVYLRQVEQEYASSQPASLPTIRNCHCGFRRSVQVILVGDIDRVNSDPVPHKIRRIRNRLSVINVELGMDQQIT